MPSISVVIPTFNHASWVLAAIESVAHQTCAASEIIVVNDGSPDNTGDILSPLIRSRQIVYIEQSNQGQASARNRGVTKAKSEYIAFLDDDDLWPADKLEWQVALLESDLSVGAVGGSAAIIDGEGTHVGSSPVAEGWATVESLLRGNPFLSPGQVVIRTEILRKIGGLNPNVWGADDYDLWFKIARVSRIRTCSRTALFYRKHASNASAGSARLFLNTVSVIESQMSLLPVGERGDLNHDVYRNLYWWLGRSFVHEFQRSVARCDLSAAAAAARSLKPLGRSMLRDPFLLKQILKDLIVCEAL